MQVIMGCKEFHNIREREGDTTAEELGVRTLSTDLTGGMACTVPDPRLRKHRN